jgi:prophage regulatory protein
MHQNGTAMLVNRRHLRLLIPASDMTIWRWERAGKFPARISINGRNYRRRDEIDDWLRCQSENRQSRPLRTGVSQS